MTIADLRERLRDYPATAKIALTVTGGEGFILALGGKRKPSLPIQIARIPLTE